MKIVAISLLVTLQRGFTYWNTTIICYSTCWTKWATWISTWIQLERFI